MLLQGLTERGQGNEEMERKETEDFVSELRSYWVKGGENIQ